MVAARVAPSTAQIISKVGDKYYSGSGFLYDRRGLIVTNDHVVEGAEWVEVFFYKSLQPYRARIVGRSTCDDLAVLSVTSPRLNPLTLGNSDQLQYKQDVVALGYSHSDIPGQTLSVTPGSVLFLHFQRNPSNDEIVLDANLSPGDSGGPLLNLKGEVVGIDFARLRREPNVGFAISVNAARPVVQQLAAGNDQNWIGMDTVELDPEYAQDYNVAVDSGILITAVTSGGPADQAKLKVGDVIQRLGNTSVESFESLCDIVKSTRRGNSLNLTVLRGNKQVITSIKPH